MHPRLHKYNDFPANPPSMILLLLLSMFAPATATHADDAVSYNSNVKPILQSRCFSCHNPEKRRGGLDMTSYQALLAGGSGGKVISPGHPDDSVILGVIMQTREPKMPPSGNKLPDSEIATIRTWIEQGCRQTPDGPAMAIEEGPGAQPLEMKSLGKVATEVPLAWPLADITRSERPDGITSIASHPGCPVVALAGQQQILIYHLPTQKLLGAVSTRPGFPRQLRFSNDGQLLMAAGGVAAQSGFVRAWNVYDGRMVVNIEHDLETVLTADIDSGFRWCAYGGPSHVVYIQDLATTTLIHQYKKHTDWITALQFSPDGLLLATADRAGGVFIWEAESHNLMHSLPTHPGAVTSLAWRGDSNLLATACEDGRVRIYEPDGGSEVKSFEANPGGVLCVSWARDGRLVTAGRDRRVKTWKPDFAPAGPPNDLDDIALACVFDASGERIIATDFNGGVHILNADKNELVAKLDSNPTPFAEQLASARERQSAAKQQVDARREAFEAAKTAMEKASQSLNESTAGFRQEDLILKQLLAGEMREKINNLRMQLVGARNQHRPAREAAHEASKALADAQAALSGARSDLDALEKSIASNAQSLVTASEKLGSLNEKKKQTQAQLDDRNAALKQLSDAADSIRKQLEKAADKSTLQQALDHTLQAIDSLTGEIASLQSQIAAVDQDITASTTAVASLQSQQTEGTRQRAETTQRITELETEIQTAKTTASAKQSELEKLVAEESAIETNIKEQESAYTALLAEVAELFK